ncbi:MAG: NAD-dependent epimerase/dehydratase family protein [Bacteroidales bacterium]|nr:NAD-dependent epimerase/dehydratase family protein [Bacteroidales bacterium]
MDNVKLNYSFLVTGGAGFIGSNVCDFLLHHGAKKVVVVDNISTGSLYNLQTILDDSRLQFVQTDINNVREYEKYLYDIEIVLHFAALGSVPRSVEDPYGTNQSNVSGTVALMQAISKLSIKPYVIFSSSSSVYGNDPHIPKREDQLGTPLSPYAVSKRSTELYLQVFSNLYEIDITVFRFFNVFGRRQNPNGPYAAVIPQFILKMIRNLPVTIYGDGNQTRDFTYIDNILHAIALAIIKRPQGFHIMNIAGGNSYSVLDMYYVLCDYLNYKIKPVFASPRPGDIRHSQADLSIAQSTLQYMPQVSFENGLILTADWYKNHMNEYVIS